MIMEGWGPSAQGICSRITRRNSATLIEKKEVDLYQLQSDLELE